MSTHTKNNQSLNLCLRNERPAEALKVCGKAAGVLAAQGMSSSLHKVCSWLAVCVCVLVCLYTSK